MRYNGFPLSGYSTVGVADVSSGREARVHERFRNVIRAPVGTPRCPESCRESARRADPSSSQRGTDKSFQRAVADDRHGSDDLYMNAQGLQENFSNGRTSRRQVRTYAELQEQLHRDLMAQHPEWIDAEGNCPACESYDRRLAQLIASFQSANRESMAQAA